MAIDCDPNALAQAARCFSCLDAYTQLQVQTYLLCLIGNAGSTGGGGTGLSGNGPPNGVVTANAGATYVDKLDGSLYWKTTDGTNTGWAP